MLAVRILSKRLHFMRAAGTAAVPRGIVFAEYM